LIPKLYGETKEELIKQLKQVDSLGFTYDYWSSSRKISYLSVTVHFVNIAWCYKNYLLGLIENDAKHTAETTAQLIINILGEYELKPLVKRLHFGVSDGEANLIDTSKEISKKTELNFIHITCIAHMLNNAMKSAIGKIGENILFEKVRGIVDRYKRSDNAANSMRTMFENLKVGNILD